MSLEQALADNTAAVKALHAHLAGAPAATPLSAKLDKVEAKIAETAKPAPKTEPKKTAAAPAPKADAVDYEKVRAAVLALCAAKGKPAGLAVLAEFGVEKATELKAEQYAEALAALEAALAAPADDIA